MTLTENPALVAVDDEYRDALAAFKAAKARYQMAGAARERAHILEELKRSKIAQQLAGLTDVEWEALRQTVDSPMPFDAELTASGPGVG